ncbi:MAG: glutamine amidotransferase [Polyangiaceae bacterium]
MIRGFEVSSDLGPAAVWVAAGLGVLSAGLLVFELVTARRAMRSALLVGVTGVLGVGALLLAILRPATVEADGTKVGPRVLVLVDASRSIDLPAESGTRRERAAESVKALQNRATETRQALASFGAGDAKPIPPEALAGGAFAVPPEAHSDLVAALDSVGRSSEERPSAIVVVSDGRLDRPGVAVDAAALRVGGAEVPIHTVLLTEKTPADASIRRVSVAGAAVAHQPFSLRVEVGCSGGLACTSVPVVARELKNGGSELLAQGDVPIADGTGTIELPVTLHLAGSHVVEVSITSPKGDEIPDNDTRFLALDVARDRIRVLHVAGRPTYDVRALRTWLKSDESVDVVAFFILRTTTDDVGAAPRDLALIPFPVDQLFNVHLRSFDAVVLQDFNAALYGLTKHLPTLATYVKEGGGLIMVGGPESFGPGMYAASPLAQVLPVTLTRDMETHGVDLSSFTPVFTSAGRAAPVLSPLRALVGDGLPEMPGTNVVGPARAGATVLWTHPTLKAGADPMPVLALGEAGNGRTIALTVDGTHKLLFSDFATETAGRAHGALWDGLLGWLMRDPRFESTVIDLPGGCIAGEDTEIVLRPLPGADGTAHLRITKLGTDETAFEGTQKLALGGPTTFHVKALKPGGFAARVEIETSAGSAPAARKDFACEKGGDEWADPRPDKDRLRAISQATGGVAVDVGAIGDIPIDAATMVNSRRTVKPVLPPWGWSLIAAVAVGAHWIARRKLGLS